MKNVGKTRYYVQVRDGIDHVSVIKLFETVTKDISGAKRAASRYANDFAVLYDADEVDAIDKKLNRDVYEGDMVDSRFNSAVVAKMVRGKWYPAEYFRNDDDYEECWE